MKVGVLNLFLSGTFVIWEVLFILRIKVAFGKYEGRIIITDISKFILGACVFMEPTDKEHSNSFQCTDALEVSLSIERQGFVFYDKAAKSAVDPRVRVVFERLANEEKEHMQSLQNKARFLQPAVANKSISRKSRAEDFINSELKGKVFPFSEEEAGKVLSDLEAINMGIEAEKRSIQVLSRLIADEKKMDVRMIFNHLLAEERLHLAALEKLKQEWDEK